MGAIILRLLASTAGKWAVAGIATLILGGAVYRWVDFKGDLRDEGRQECIQQINQETMDALQDALAAEQIAHAELKKKMAETDALNADARARATAAEQKLEELQNERDEQAETDLTYRAWSDTPLPDGVADRLQRAAGSDSRSDNADGN